MTAFSKQEMTKLAKLARLDLPENDLMELGNDMTGIFKMVESLQSVNTDGVEGLASVSQVTLPWRKDEVNDGGKAEAVVKNAPDTTHNFFVVPKMVGGE